MLVALRAAAIVGIDTESAVASSAAMKLMMYKLAEVRLNGLFDAFVLVESMIVRKCLEDLVGCRGRRGRKTA